jgi:AcrR family transcriptional regulator
VTRDRILDTAEALFAEHGFAATSVRDIAARAGLTPASLYNHFSGKEALYQAVLARGVKPLLEMMREVSQREPTPDATEQVIAAVMAYLAQRPHLPRLIHQEVVSGGEQLSALARDWVTPLLETAAVQLARDPRSPWELHEQPLAIAMWMQLVLGHFALSPLLRGAAADDPLSPEGIARQTRFLQKLSRLLLRADAPQTE